MLSFLFGLIAVLLGALGMRMWNAEWVSFLKGMIPMSLFFAGLIAIIAGFASLTSKPPHGPKKGS